MFWLHDAAKIVVFVVVAGDSSPSAQNERVEMMMGVIRIRNCQAKYTPSRMNN